MLADDDGSDELVQVGEEVLVGALDVQARPVGLRQDPRGEDVDCDPDKGHDQDRAAVDRWWVEESADGFVPDDPDTTSRLMPLPA